MGGSYDDDDSKWEKYVPIVGGVVAVILIGVLIYYIFIKKSKPNNSCPDGMVKSDQCDKDGCIKVCADGTLYNCSTKTCGPCDDKNPLCGSICCPKGHCQDNGECCAPDRYCTDPTDPSKKKCCGGGSICVNGVCSLVCGDGLLPSGKPLVCAAGEECMTISNAPPDVVKQILNLPDGKAYVDADGSTIHLCRNKAGDAVFSNELEAPYKINDVVQPCFRLPEFSGFCTSPTSDVHAKNNCYTSHSNEKDCNENNCVWWDVLKEGARIFTENKFTKMDGLQEEYALASSQQFNGYYCTPSGEKSMSRVLAVEGADNTTFENCAARLANNSVSNIFWDQQNKVCMSLQDCMQPCLDPSCAHPNPDQLQGCPQTMKADNYKFKTDGQIYVDQGETTYKCQLDGKCVEFGTTKSNPRGNYDDMVTCQKECKKIDIPYQVKGAWCNSYDVSEYRVEQDCWGGCHWHTNPSAPYDICSNFAIDKHRDGQPSQPEIDRDHYNWTCTPTKNGDNYVCLNDNGAYPTCDCSGHLNKNTCDSIYQREDLQNALLLPGGKNDPCFMSS